MGGTAIVGGGVRVGWAVLVGKKEASGVFSVESLAMLGEGVGGPLGAGPDGVHALKRSATSTKMDNGVLCISGTFVRSAIVPQGRRLV
jgi:hypothetical protein